MNTSVKNSIRLSLTETEQHQVHAYQESIFARGDVTEEQASDQATRYAEGLIAYRLMLVGVDTAVAPIKPLRRTQGKRSQMKRAS
jgi:hypothetical protein